MRECRKEEERTARGASTVNCYRPGLPYLAPVSGARTPLTFHVSISPAPLPGSRAPSRSVFLPQAQGAGKGCALQLLGELRCDGRVDEQAHGHRRLDENESNGKRACA